MRPPVSLPQTWAEFADAMLPGVQWLYQNTTLPAWLTLAMAAHESGVPVQAGSTYAVETNPWGVRCFQPQYACSSEDFQVYPSLLAAAQSLPAALGPSRLAFASDPAAFMSNLQATGWDVPATGYAASVLYTYGPAAQEALESIGADITTGATGGGTTPPPTTTQETETTGTVMLLGLVAAGIAALAFAGAGVVGVEEGEGR